MHVIHVNDVNHIIDVDPLLARLGLELESRTVGLGQDSDGLGNSRS